MSLALRHEPAALGITLDEHGWTDVAALLAGLAAKGIVLDEDGLEELVRDSDKQRFALSPDGARIRANQGHSVAIDLDLPARAPPDFLFHGTVARFLEPITKEGLQRRARTHVHLSADVETAETVARRRSGEVVILKVRARAMHDAGNVFYLSENGVWLTEHVPPGIWSSSRTMASASAGRPRPAQRRAWVSSGAGGGSSRGPGRVA